ncbi:phosphatase PAP2 family protein [Peribacillus sp. TH16]|uniref:phosphatase PAP2 family protein n=1 Tax=Peribacillus TaxID=2675229 RepID=UPI0019120244|nr:MULTISPECIES: phosphatase PAP2 family protein [unclassified Peribacillus]MBK5445447.1 phosphatase PAP2 family protein [Peribacillus sp. TH24]MBK5459830.1 phosphatase PAP2 family protein [Peribacillus sp. TH27]MBK5481642.1 phosphatase PAP2 family protein [Peribacillus sp. TH16]WMX56865.1 phosphatase PAP2 family protein [Peribacillus sp. R9-11]
MIKYARITVILLCMIIFIFLMNEVQNGKVLAFDEFILDHLTVVENTYLFTFFKSITYFGSSIFIGFGSLLFILYLWMKKKDYLAIAVFSIGVAGGDLLKRGIKNLIQRERPENHLVNAAGFSFPSGHSMVGLIFFSMIAYFIIKEVKSKSVKWGVGISFTLLVLVIGISRIALKVHFPTDVLAGFVLGVGYSLTCLCLYQWLERRVI